MLHVTPPMSAPDVLKSCTLITDAAGYLDVNKHTLQHNKYKNIFGVGDCTNVPTSKTAAAVGKKTLFITNEKLLFNPDQSYIFLAGELGVIRKNLAAAIEGKPLSASYNGYTSCPLVVR